MHSTACSLNEMCTRGRRVEPIREILGFVGDQSVAEFHDTHCVGWNTVITKYEFGDPEIATADNSLDGKALLVWLDGSALLDVAPSPDPFAGLRIIEHSVLAVDFMLGNEIVRVRSIPVPLQRRPHGSIVHLVLPVGLSSAVSDR